MAGIALARGVNANLVHRWLRLATPTPAAKIPGRLAENGGGGGGGEFVALQLPAPPVVAAPPDIRIELRRGSATVTVSWPMAGSADCAAWLREWLR